MLKLKRVKSVFISFYHIFLKDIESFFGSVGDLTDEMFDDIFTNKQKAGHY